MLYCWQLLYFLVLCFRSHCLQFLDLNGTVKEVFTKRHLSILLIPCFLTTRAAPLTPCTKKKKKTENQFLNDTSYKLNSISMILGLYDELSIKYDRKLLNSGQYEGLQPPKKAMENIWTLNRGQQNQNLQDKIKG